MQIKGNKLSDSDSDNSVCVSEDDSLIFLLRSKRTEILDLRDNMRLRLKELLEFFVSYEFGLSMSPAWEALSTGTFVAYWAV